MPALRKPLIDIVPDDLQAVIGWVEDEVLEFKQTLAHTGSDKPDKWMIDQSSVGPRAQREILAEVVAMANSYGGDVILGIEEGQEMPHRAMKLSPLPKCIDLASRLEHAARDLIKPQIPMLGVRGIPTEGDNGVVVFRAPRSRNAPHRLEMKDMVKECYRRVSDRTEVMSMREIQDLTFSAARGIEHVDQRLSEIRKEFRDWVTGGNQLDRHWGYSVVAVPLSSDLYLERVYKNDLVKPVSRSFKAKFYSAGPFEDYSTYREAFDYRPILRGTEATLLSEAFENIKRVMCDGSVVDFHRYTAAAADPTSRIDSEFCLFPSWLFAAVINCFEHADKFRTAAASNTTQCAIEIAIETTAPLSVLRPDGRAAYATINPQGKAFPHYQIGDRDTWYDALRLIWIDFFHAIGKDPGEKNPEVEGW